MATISKLAIRGIRSFGIDKEDEQKISFNSPLTLIVGQNGSGKTTIIECLKYALTGEAPPGTNRGQSFVHDPNIFNSVESLGQVKLKVKDIKGNEITCVRSMKTSIKKTKLSFETLDSTIHVVDENGRTIDISKRCVDTNTEMCQAMGVSKSILNNVIFCHQEDSNWPLDEGKKLKEKFDSIFETTQYNKAIDKIMKQRKAHQSKLKDKNNELKILEIKKNEADTKRDDLQFNNDKLDGFEEECKKIDDSMEPIIDRLKKIQEIQIQIGKLASQEQMYKMEIKSCREKQEKLKGDISKVLIGDIESLQLDLQSHKAFQRTNEEKLKKLENELAGLKIKERQIQEKINNISKVIQTYIMEISKEQDLLGDRSTELKSLCRKINVQFNDSLDSQNMEGFDDVYAQVVTKIKEEEKKLDNLGTEFDSKDQELQKKIDELREKKASTQSIIGTKQKTLQDLEKEDKVVQREVANNTQYSQLLGTLIQNIDDCEKGQAQFEKNANIDSKKTKMNASKAKKLELKNKLKAVEEDFDILNSLSTITNDIESKKRDKLKKEGELQRIKNKHSDNLRTLFPGKTIDKNYKNTVQSLYNKVNSEFEALTKSLNAALMKSNNLMTMRNTLKKQLKTDEKDLESIEEKIDDQCGGSDYLETVNKLKEKIEKQQKELGFKKHSEAFYKQYISKISDDSCCLLCHRNFDTSDGDDLKVEYEEKIRMLPREIAQSEKELKNDMKRYDNLISLRSDYERIESIKNKIKKSQTDLKNNDEEYKNIQTEIENLELSKTEPKSHLTLANSIIGDMSLLDECDKDIQNKTNEIEILRCQLPENTPAKSLEEVQNDRKLLNTQLDEEEKNLSKLEEDINVSQEELHKMRQNLDKLKNKKIELQDKIMKASKSLERSKEIQTEKAGLIKELEEQKAKLLPIDNEFKKFITLKQETKNSFQKKIQTTRKFVDEIRSNRTEIERLTKEIKASQNEKFEEKKQAKEAELRTIKNEQTTLNTNAETKTEGISKLKEDIANYALNERNLRDNLELKELEEKEKELCRKHEELRKNIGDLDPNKLNSERQKLTEKEDSIKNQRSLIKGKISEVKVTIESLKKQLNNFELKNAHKNFIKVFYEVRVIEQIINDLGKYKSALEWALMKYHSDKMENINKIIKDLWTNIYRGNDIDYVKIKTDEIKETNADKRRSYNYRVVAARNGDIEIDMRGRCSAGQKVLASLIIRIALANTFSHNCGVLTLDEPTTNLDRNNIGSLCEALCQIVEESKNSNFMLIIITHDEEFVTALDKVEHYYRLSRTNSGKSKIERIDN